MIKKRTLINAMVALIAIGITSTQVVHAQSGIISSNDINQAILIDKSHPLQPLTYAPPVLTVPPVLLAEPVIDPEMQLAPSAAEALTNLFGGAGSDNINLVLSSGYRSYNDQAVLYAAELNTDGVFANKAVAPPGFSEHQSGLAADIILSDYFCASQGCFALSKAATWLSQNSYKYGFMVRYPLYKEASTGYEYEPWHIRYVGTLLARQLHASQKTLEEFYGLP
jgi:D-alanyl-D-alanine carboxypeptidase